MVFSIFCLLLFFKQLLLFINRKQSLRINTNVFYNALNYIFDFSSLIFNDFSFITFKEQ